MTPPVGATTRPWRRRTALGAIAATMLLVACRRAPDVVSVPRWTPVRDTLLAVDAGRDDSLGIDVRQRFMGMLSPDAAFLRNGAPLVFGRAGIDGLLAARAEFPRIAGWDPLGAGVSSDGRSAYTYGATVLLTAAGQPIVERYLAFWTRSRGEPWRIRAYAEIGSSVMTLGAAGSAKPAANAPLSEEVKGIAYADSSFGEHAGTYGMSSAFADVIATDGIYLGAPELLVGPVAVREYFASRRGTSVAWRPSDVFASAGSDLGFSVGESVTTSRGPSGAAVQRFGKYLSVWRKDARGAWKIAAVGSNARPSPVRQ